MHSAPSPRRSREPRPLADASGEESPPGRPAPPAPRQRLPTCGEQSARRGGGPRGVTEAAPRAPGWRSGGRDAPRARGARVRGAGPAGWSARWRPKPPESPNLRGRLPSTTFPAAPGPEKVLGTSPRRPDPLRPHLRGGSAATTAQPARWGLAPFSLTAHSTQKSGVSFGPERGEGGGGAGVSPRWGGSARALPSPPRASAGAAARSPAHPGRHLRWPRASSEGSPVSPSPPRPPTISRAPAASLPFAAARSPAQSASGSRSGSGGWRLLHAVMSADIPHARPRGLFSEAPTPPGTRATGRAGWSPKGRASRTGSRVPGPAARPTPPAGLGARLASLS